MKYSRSIILVAIVVMLLSCAVQRTIPIGIINPESEVQSEMDLLANKLSRNLNRRIIAVLPFLNLNKDVTRLGRSLAVDLQAALIANRGPYVVVERDLFGLTIEKEIVFMLSVMVDRSTAVKLGRIYGANTLIVGHVYDTGDSLKLTVKVLDTATARIISIENILISRTSERIRQNRSYGWRFQYGQ